MLDFPATYRNRGPLLEVLRDRLPESGTVLEVGSGSGQHIAFFAAQLPHLTFQPSDVQSDHVASIQAWVKEAGVTNVETALLLDACQPGWPLESVEAVLCVNVIHIAPWEVCQSLMRESGRLLAPGAPLILYGAMQLEGRHVSQSNVEFDRGLRAQDPRWGVRDLEQVDEAASCHGLQRDELIKMPANNFVVVYRRISQTPKPARAL